MGNCIYKYRGIEYSDKEELKNVLQQEIVTDRLTAKDKTSFVITGDKPDLAIQQMIIEEEAIYNYGTSEHVSFNQVGDTLEVTIDGKAIEDMNSGEKLLFNELTGELESFNIEEQIEREKGGATIPIRNWQEEKVLYFAEKVYDKIWNGEREPLSNSESDLKEKLYAFAQKLGINITTLDNWLKDNAERKDVDLNDVNGLADMLTRTIAVANKDDINQLTEEIAHFAIEYSNNQEVVQRMLEAVPQTDAYKAEAEKYRLKYSKQPKADGTKRTTEEIEQKVRKEILGKILAQKIKDNFNTEAAQNSAEVGIFTQLKNLWDRFINLFKETDQNKEFFKEFGSVLDKLSNQVVDNEDRYFSPVDSREVYYSMDSEQKELHNNINNFLEKLRGAYRNLIKEDDGRKGARNNDLKAIEDQLTYNKYGQVLNSAVSIFENDVSYSVNLINNAKKEGGNYGDNINVESVCNLNTHHNNFKTYSQLIKNELNNFQRLLKDGIVDDTAIKQSDIISIKNRLKEIGRQYGSIEDDIQELISEKGRDIIEKEYKKWGADEQVVKNAVGIMDRPFFKNINIVQEYLFPIKGINNPIFQAVHALIVIAEGVRNKAATIFGENGAKIVVKHNISDVDAMSLIKNGQHMMNPQNTRSIEKFFEILKDEYDAKIEELNKKIENTTTKSERVKYQEQKVKLVAEKIKALEEQREIWEELPVTKERLQEMAKLSKPAKDLILDRAQAKRKIFDKYRLSDGSVPIQNISNADYNELQQIEANYKERMSPNNRDGSLKEDIALQTARDLMEYRDNIIKSNKDVPYANEDFKKNALINGIKFKKIDKSNDFTLEDKHPPLTEGQKRWLAANAIYTYSEDVRKFLDNEGGVQVDTEEMPILKDSVINEILSNLNIRYKDSNGNIRTTLPNQNEPNSYENYQAIYESLLEKRQHIVAPYKVQGKIGEIDGTAISQQQQVLDALNLVNSQFKYFKLVENPNIGRIYEGNEAFKKEINQLTGQALINFKKKAQVDDKGIPHAYHYRKVIITNADKVEFPKTYQPNFKWQANEGMNSFYNPKYNKKIAGKTVQLKLTNDKLKDKIPTNIIEQLKKKNIIVKDGMTFKELFIDKDFFDKFGIDEKTDFWGEKGATKNKGLWELREFLLKEKDKADKNYGLYNSLFHLPQVLGRAKELNKGIGAGRVWFSREFLDENDDSVSGDRSRITVPRRYIREIEPSKISNDISYLYGKYVEAAVNYREKNAILPQIHLLTERLRNSTVGGSNVNVTGTRLFKMLDKWLSVNLYGNLVDEIGWAETVKNKTADIAENNLPKSLQPYVGTFRKISPTKSVHFFYKYLRNTYLGLNPTVTFANMLNTATNTIIEHLSENQVSNSSLTWSTGMVGRYYGQHVFDSGSISPKSKLVKLLRYANMYYTPEKVYDGVTKNILFRSVDEPLFIQSRGASVGIAAHAMFSMFDSYRLIDGEFININTFRDKRRAAAKSVKKELTDEQINNEWATYRDKNYYSFLKENDREIEIDKQKLIKAGFIEENIPLLETRIITNAQNFNAKIEGQANLRDKPIIFSRPDTMFLGAFSQYFFNFLYTRFSGSNYNLLENRNEEGSYVTFAKLMKEILIDDKMSGAEKMKDFGNLMASMVTLGMYAEGLKELKPYQQTNIRKISLDVAMYGVLFSMFLLMNASADDDKDDALKQYLALLASRGLVEHGSSMLPFALTDVAQRFKSPVPGMDLVQEFMNIPMLVTDEGGEEISRGKFKGWTKREKAAIKLTFIRNIYSNYYKPAENYRQSNMYFRSNVLNLPNDILENIKEE